MTNPDDYEPLTVRRAEQLAKRLARDTGTLDLSHRERSEQLYVGGLAYLMAPGGTDVLVSDEGFLTVVEYGTNPDGGATLASDVKFGEVKPFFARHRGRR